MPDSAQIWKEFGVTMQIMCGHNDRNKSYMNYWEDSEPVDWPKEATEQRWPPHRKLAAPPVTTEAAQTPGKCPAKVVKGVTAKTSPNEFFASKMPKYTFVGSVGVSNLKDNILREKRMPDFCLRYQGT
jgi:hypothetical protein